MIERSKSQVCQCPRNGGCTVCAQGGLLRGQIFVRFHYRVAHTDLPRQSGTDPSLLSRSWKLDSWRCWRSQEAERFRLFGWWRAELLCKLQGTGWVPGMCRRRRLSTAQPARARVVQGHLPYVRCWFVLPCACRTARIKCPNTGVPHAHVPHLPSPDWPEVCLPCLAVPNLNC